MHFEQDSPVRDDGSLSLTAPSFLRLLRADLQSVLPRWAAFNAGWGTSMESRVGSPACHPQTGPVQSAPFPSDLVDEPCV